MSNKKVLGPPVGYTDLLDAEIVDKIAKDETNFGFPLRPSAAGYCSRRLAYDLMQYKGFAKYEKEKMEPTVYRLLSLGHSVEFSALKHLELLPGFKLRYKQQAVTLFPLKPVGDEAAPLIEGSVDVVLWSDNYKCLLDVKSQKDGWSVAYKSRWQETLDKYNQMPSLQRIGENAWYADSLDDFVDELGDDFLVDNLLQLNLYVTSTFAKERGIDHAVIYKYNKNTSDHYELRFRPSDKLAKKIKDKFQHIYDKVMEQKPDEVKKDCKLGSMRCAFCPYKDLCWGDNDPLKQWFKTFPKKEWAVGEDKHPTLKPMFKKLLELDKEAEAQETIRENIIQYMLDHKIKKIKLANGYVYELKLLKTPREHFELRRSKE